MRARALWIATVAVMASTLLGTPASAETKVKDDQLGDAPAAIDITRARYVHNDDAVIVVAKIPDLGGAGEAQLAVSRFEIFEAGYVVRLIKRRGEPATVGLFYFDHFDLLERDCDAVEGAWRAHSIRIEVSRDCLKGHKRDVVFAQVATIRGEKVDRAPAVRRLARG